MESEAVIKGEQFKNTRTAYAFSLNRNRGQIADKKQKLEQLQAGLSATEDEYLTIQGNKGPSALPPQQSKSTITSSSTAQTMIEKIYGLIGENRMAEAHSLFISNKNDLQKYAILEAIQMLESSF